MVDAPSIDQDQPLLFPVRLPFDKTRGGPAVTTQADIPAITAMLQDQTKAPFLQDIDTQPFLYKERKFEHVNWSARPGTPNQHTGCIWIEVVGDNAPLIQSLRSRISTDPHTLALFANLAGDGFNLVVRTTLTDPQMHAHYGRGWQEYLQQVYQCHALLVQLALQPPAVWCPLGVDQQAYLNPNARIFTLTPLTLASLRQHGLGGTPLGELRTAYTHLLADAQVGLTDPLAPPLACLLLHNEGQLTILGTLGKLGVILDQAHRSSRLLQRIIASALGPGTGPQGLVARCPPDKPTVLLLDTGRSPYRLQQFSRGLASLTGQPELSLLKTYALSAYPPSVRAALVALAIYQTDQLGLVIIEQIEDLLDESADEHAISRLMAQLRKWAEQLGFYLLVVHRQPPAEPRRSQPAAGSWRAQLEASAETLLTIRRAGSQQGAAYEVWAQVGPQDETDSVVFSLDSSGAIRVVDAAGSSEADQGDSNQLEPPLAPDGHPVMSLLDKAFAHQSRLQYGQLYDALLLAAKSAGTPLGNRSVQKLIQSLVRDGYLLKCRHASERYPHYKRHEQALLLTNTGVN